MGYHSYFSSQAAFSSSSSEERDNSWEFPILLKYKVPSPLLKPFVEAGFAPRVLNGHVTTQGSAISSSPGIVVSHSDTNWPSTIGFVVGGGIRLDVGRLQLSPGVRYTRWSEPAISASYPFGDYFQSSQNQFDVLLGVGWKIH